MYFPTTNMALAESLASSPLRHERKLGQKAIKKEWFLEEQSVHEIAKLLGKGNKKHRAKNTVVFSTFCLVIFRPRIPVQQG